jgi:hypothetical protein
MNWSVRLPLITMAGGFSLVLFALAASAQTPNARHVVTHDDLRQDALRVAQTRQADEAAIRHLLSSDAGRQALKSADVDYARVDKAIHQLNDEELARLADRSRQAQSDFAAGLISAKTLAYIILILVVVITIAVLV